MRPTCDTSSLAIGRLLPPTNRCEVLSSAILLLVFSCFVTSSPIAIGDSIALSELRKDLYHSGWIDFNKNRKQDVYESANAPVEERVEDLLRQMTIEEKTCQLVTLYGYGRVVRDDLPTPKWKQEVWKDGLANIDEHINGIAGYQGKKESKYVWPPSVHAKALNEVQRWFVEETRLGIPVDFTNEGIRGVCHHGATNFPAQVGIGATWDVDLVTEIGRVTGTEGRALGYTNIYSPILDLSRDPRWGRVVECYGEDPFLVSALGVAQAKALQASGVASTPKHYAVYSIPKGGRDGHARTDPHVSPREMREMYLAPFEAVVREADVLGMMSSYNDFDGVPISGSRFMLTDLLRKEFGFRGYVVSDSDAVIFLHSKHRVAPTIHDAISQFLNAGGNVRTEFNLPHNFLTPLRRLIAERGIDQAVIDQRVREVLGVKFQLGLFDAPYSVEPQAADQAVRNENHRSVALRAARESIVLLKNEDKTLPLSKELRSILVCGPNATTTGHCISRYGPTGGSVVSVLEGIRSAVSPHTDVRYEEGCKITDQRWPESEIFPEPPSAEEQAMIERAVTAAEGVDVVVAVLGESEDTVGESRSRTDLNLTGYQLQLVRELLATGKPLIVVLINGRALTINWIDRHVPAIVEAWFPGECCGQAIADVLFGDYNPGGKLPVTFPRTVGQVPYNFPFKPASQAGQGSDGDPNGVGTTRITGELYPFGHGLSYTQFEYDNLEISPASVEAAGTVRVKCGVHNVGKRAGDEVVQLYLVDDYSSLITYDSVLRGFQRIHLDSGETTVVEFELGPQHMQMLDSSGSRIVEPGGFTVRIGSSSRDIRLQGSFKVE